ncbi:MAG: hypothetical protein ONB41_07720 [candidate division KSB1 bacterium]|nr:hypothetical protein [candidate division KSB1 bacterium]
MAAHRRFDQITTGFHRWLGLKSIREICVILGTFYTKCRIENTVDRTNDEVVFAEKGDLALLGTRTLGGLNLTVDATRKKLVAAGPIPAAAMHLVD